MNRITIAAPTNEEFEKMQAEHPRCRLLSFDEDAVHVVIRPPTSAEYRRFKDALRVDQQRATAGENLARACVLYPAADRMAAVTSELPAVWDNIAGEVLELAGSAPAKKVR